MENKILICEMECYRKASQGQKEKVKWEWGFDLMQLPAEGLRTEFSQFLMERANNITVSTMAKDRFLYNRICCFLKDRGIQAESFQDKPLEEWIRKLNGWLMQNSRFCTRMAP